MNTMSARISYYFSSISLALACAFPVSIEAKTLYVNGTTGNDSATYAANGESAPWRTIGRAAWGSTNRNLPNADQAARAGDTVLVAAGTYTSVGTGVRYDPVYNPVNSGTSGSPITFEAVGTVTFSYTSGRGPVIGAYQRNYIVWKGFQIDEALTLSVPDTGPVVFWACTGGGAYNLTLDGNGDPGFGDNHPGIRLEGATNVTIQNNRIHDFRTSGVNAANGNGIQTYHSFNLTIENNEIYNNGSGIFLKANINNPTGINVVRYNRVYNVAGTAIIVHINAAGSGNRIYQNIVTNAAACVKLWQWDADNYPRNTTIANNTCHNNSAGLSFQGTVPSGAGNSFYNNIISTSAKAVYSENGTTANASADRFNAAHNLYYSYSTFAEFLYVPYTLATWQGSLGQDTITPTSISANPLFTDISSDNFRLQPGSPALNLGIDVLDLNNNGSRADIIPAGAYISGNEIIGLGELVSGGYPADPAPATPVNFRIQ